MVVSLFSTALSEKKYWPKKKKEKMETGESCSTKMDLMYLLL